MANLNLLEELIELTMMIAIGFGLELPPVTLAKRQSLFSNDRVA